jgi:hypothetical protein
MRTHTILVGDNQELLTSFWDAGRRHAGHPELPPMAVCDPSHADKPMTHSLLHSTASPIRLPRREVRCFPYAILSFRLPHSLPMWEVRVGVLRHSCVERDAAACCGYCIVPSLMSDAGIHCSSLFHTLGLPNPCVRSR